MVAADDDGPGEFSGRYHLVEHQAGAVAVAEADPANAGGQALEGDPLARHVQPAVQAGVVGEQRLHRRIGLADIVRIAGQGGPAERADAAAEEGTDIGGDEAGEVEGLLHTGIEGDLADVVAIVGDGDAHGLEIQHGLNMVND